MAISISGKADPNLIKMATAAEIASAPLDMKDEFQSIADNYTTFMKGIGELYTQEKAKLQAKKKPFEDIFEKIEKEYTNGTYSSDEVKYYSKQLDYYRGQILRGSKADRTELMGRVQKFYNSVAAGNGENLTYVKMISNGGHDYNTMSLSRFKLDSGEVLEPGEAIDVFTALAERNFSLNFKNDTKNYKVKVGDRTVTVSQPDLDKIFHEKQKGADEILDQIVESNKQLAITPDGEFNNTKTASRINDDVLSNKKYFNYVVNNPVMDNPYSVRDLMHQPGTASEQIYISLNDVLPKSLIDKLNVGEDGIAGTADDGEGLDASDFLNEEVGAKNWNTIIDTLLNRGSDFYNEDISKRFVSEILSQGVKTQFDIAAKDKGPVWAASIGISNMLGDMLDYWKNGNLEDIDLMKAGHEIVKDGDKLLLKTPANPDGVEIDTSNPDMLRVLLKQYGDDSVTFKNKYNKFVTEWNPNDWQYGTMEFEEEGEEGEEGTTTTTTYSMKEKSYLQYLGLLDADENVLPKTKFVDFEKNATIKKKFKTWFSKSELSDKGFKVGIGNDDQLVIEFRDPNTNKLIDKTTVELGSLLEENPTAHKEILDQLMAFNDKYINYKAEELGDKAAYQALTQNWSFSNYSEDVKTFVDSGGRKDREILNEVRSKSNFKELSKILDVTRVDEKTMQNYIDTFLATHIVDPKFKLEPFVTGQGYEGIRVSFGSEIIGEIKKPNTKRAFTNLIKMVLAVKK
jgi:hypothetical protein